MDEFRHLLSEHPNWLPFFLVARRASDSGSLPEVRLNTAKLIEALLIAGITGGVVMYGVQMKLDAQMADLRSQIAMLQTRIAEQRAESASRADRIEAKVDNYIQLSVTKR